MEINLPQYEIPQLSSHYLIHKSCIRLQNISQFMFSLLNLKGFQLDKKIPYFLKIGYNEKEKPCHEIHAKNHEDKIFDLNQIQLSSKIL